MDDLTPAETMMTLAAEVRELERRLDDQRASLRALMAGAQANGETANQIAAATGYATSTVYRRIQEATAVTRDADMDSLRAAAETMRRIEADLAVATDARNRQIKTMRQTETMQTMTTLTGLSAGRIAQIAPISRNVLERMARVRAARGMN